MSKSIDYLNVERVALRLIARAEQCTNGLTRKLEKRGFDTVCIKEVISDLSDKKLLDDSRFARLWLHSRLRFAKSPRRLLLSLCARGIDRDDAEAALNEVLGEDDTEIVMLTKFVKKYSKKASGDPRSLKYMLKNEGFSLTAIQQFMGDEY